MRVLLITDYQRFSFENYDTLIVGSTKSELDMSIEYIHDTFKSTFCVYFVNDYI